MVRQDPFFHSDQVDMREFQPLGAVQRHQHDRVPPQLLVFFAVEVLSPESDVVEEIRRASGSPGFRFIGADRVDDFLDRMPTAIADRWAPNRAVAARLR